MTARDYARFYAVSPARADPGPGWLGRVLAKEKGSLSEYLTGSPIRYLEDYIKVCGTKPSEKCEYTVQAQTAETVLEIDRRLAEKR